MYGYFHFIDGETEATHLMSRKAQNPTPEPNPGVLAPSSTLLHNSELHSFEMCKLEQRGESDLSEVRQQESGRSEARTPAPIC